MAFYWRIWAAIAIVNLVVLATFVGLATLQFGSIGNSLAGERLLVLAGRTAAPFASAAKIGLPVSAVRNADALLEQARQTDDAISAIHVFDMAGRIVHSTTLPAPAEIAADAIEAGASAGEVPWYLETDDGLVGGVNIVSSDGTNAGGILIVFSSGGILTRVWAMAAELSVSAFIVLVVAMALGALSLRFGLSRQIGFFQEIERTISRFERHSWRSAAGWLGTAAEFRPANELLVLLDEAEARYQAAGQAIQSARDSAK